MATLLDLQESITAANGNVTLARDLFAMLLSELKTRIKQIETSFYVHDLQGLAECTHKLYGATAYCIVPQLRSSTEKLENALTNGELNNLEILVEQIKSDIQELINEGPRFLAMDWEKYR